MHCRAAHAAYAAAADAFAIAGARKAVWLERDICRLGDADAFRRAVVAEAIGRLGASLIKPLLRGRAARWVCADAVETIETCAVRGREAAGTVYAIIRH